MEIFLDRSIHLSTLFQRYCTFANTYPSTLVTPKKSERSNPPSNENHHESTGGGGLAFDAPPSLSETLSSSSTAVLVEPGDLEFHHCFILDPSQTVDTSALMHKDKIRVRAYQREERKLKIERLKLQQEIDKNYFDQLRLLMPDLTPSFLKCDIIFQCMGRITDEKGLKQEVLNTYVKGNSALLVKRCPWLRMKIAWAKMLFHPQQQVDIETKDVISDSEGFGTDKLVSSQRWRNRRYPYWGVIIFSESYQNLFRLYIG